MAQGKRKICITRGKNMTFLKGKYPLKICSIWEKEKYYIKEKLRKETLLNRKMKINKQFFILKNIKKCLEIFP